MPSKKQPKIIAFRSKKDFKSWLSENYNCQEGIWLKFYKKSSDKKTITYNEALEEALCYGWIDGQAKKYDEISWLQKFTPRRKNSIWSKRNVEKAESLIAKNKMQLSGFKEIERAKSDGRWENSYHSPKNSVIPKDFLKELSRYPKAEEHFKTLNKTNRYSIAWRLQTAKKPETRSKRLKKIIKMMENKEKFH